MMRTSYFIAPLRLYPLLGEFYGSTTSPCKQIHACMVRHWVPGPALNQGDPYEDAPILYA